MELPNTSESMTELLQLHVAHFEVFPCFASSVSQPHKKVHAGFEMNLYGKAADHVSLFSDNHGELRETLHDLSAACQEVVANAAESSRIEIIPSEATLILNVRQHFEPEALVRIRITHSNGFDQPVSATEEKTLAGVTQRLESLGVRRN